LAGGVKAYGMSGTESAFKRARHLVRRREMAGAWAGLILHGAAAAADLGAPAQMGEAQRQAASVGGTL
jgi:hypothetical protein